MGNVNKKFCPYCKSSVNENVKFCPKCGAKVEDYGLSSGEGDIIVESQGDSSNSTGSSKKVWLIVGIVIFLIIAVAITVWLLFFNDKNSDKDKKEDGNNVVINNGDDTIDEDDDNTNIEDNDDDDDDSSLNRVKYYGVPYQFSDGYAWFKDSSYIYLINQKGKIVNKFDGKGNDGYYDFQNSNFNDDYAMIGSRLYNDEGKEVEVDFKYDSISYYDSGLLVVTVKEEDYKGVTYKRGIYDLDNKKYVYSLDESISRIDYLGEDMYLLVHNDEKCIVFNAETGKSFDIGDRFDVLKTEYKDGYIIYQNTNADEVYAIDKLGNKTLIASNSRHAQMGQYSDGLVFINDSFYDIKGNVVISLKDEGITNNPVFVNGYALVFFKTGYFTVLSKETKKYMFDPKAYTYMGNTYNGSFSLGIYDDQKVISSTGHIIVRLYDEVLKTKRWAIMDVAGNIVYEFTPAISIYTLISDSGYIGVTDSSNNESYFVSVKGDKLFISE